jgi:hypothetical protein
MLSRKEKDKSDVDDKSLNIASKEPPCKERYLEELPGYVEVELLFDVKNKLLDNPFKISLPVCLINILSNKEELVFERILLKNENYKKISLQNDLNSLFEEFENLQRFVNDNKTMNELMLEEAKILLNKLQFIHPALIDNIAKNIDDTQENINVY